MLPLLFLCSVQGSGLCLVFSVVGWFGAGYSSC